MAYIHKTPTPKKPSRLTRRDGREICRTAPAWQARRAEVFARDNGRCQGRIANGRVTFACDKLICLADAEIDHIRVRGIGGGKRDDRLENLQTLCHECHMAKHGQAVASEVDRGQEIRRGDRFRMLDRPTHAGDVVACTFGPGWVWVRFACRCRMMHAGKIGERVERIG